MSMNEDEFRMPNLGPLLGVVAVVLLVVLVAFLAISGFYQVKPGEAAAIQTFGAARAEPNTSEGLGWHWPWPIGTVTVEQVQKSRTAEVGFFTLPEGRVNPNTGENWRRDLGSATMIIGDLNLLEMQVVAQYHIGDLNSYLFRADDPGVVYHYTHQNGSGSHRSHIPGRPDGQTIKDALEVAIRRSVGQRSIDQVLVSDRESIERETMLVAQDILDEYRTGLTITSVQLQEVKPPEEVKNAFDDVLRAREEKDTRINQALAFESKVLPEARGAAQRLLRESEAYRAERIAAAQGEADRFLSILAEYRASPEIIAKRMYLETIDRVLPNMEQVLVTGTNSPVLILDLNDAGAESRRVIPAPTQQADPTREAE